MYIINELIVWKQTKHDIQKNEERALVLTC